MRCFVGIPLPESYQEGLLTIVQNWQKKLHSKISWTKKGNWHMTLFFLGQISEDNVEQVKEKLKEVSMNSFSLQARGGGFFPPGKQPRVLWVGLETGHQECIQLAEKIENNLHDLGFESDKKSFRPHLTLGRVKQNRKDNWSEFIDYLTKIDWPLATIDSFNLWKSDLTPQGPIYSVIENYPLD